MREAVLGQSVCPQETGDLHRFRQNGSASQHVRKEPAKNKFLVDFCFELTAQRLFSSDLPQPTSQIFGLYKERLPLPPKKTLSLKTISR